MVINSGNANACTGERGLDDARKMAALAAAACGAGPEEALVMSTGIIGEFLPMDKIEQGITAAAVKLGREARDLEAAARAIMTTDTVTKLAGRTLSLGGQDDPDHRHGQGRRDDRPEHGHDARPGADRRRARRPASPKRRSRPRRDESFNCDQRRRPHEHQRHRAAAGQRPSRRAAAGGDDLAAFRTALNEVCVELARAIPADGEGATHLITIDVTGCASRGSARRIAKTVAESAAGQDGDRRRRSELGAHRLGGRLRGRAVRPGGGRAFA